MNNCSILKYGIKKSTEDIKYSYCKTCDPNLTNPICLPCINNCHIGHLIKYVLNKGKIRCSCGEKNHYQNKINNNLEESNNIICLFNEWNKIANLGFYYINKNKNPICILCHNFCVKDNKKDKIIKLENNLNIPNCSCKNEEIHISHKINYEQIINLIKEPNEFKIFLHPIKFINMIFKSNNFKIIFEDFEKFMNNLNHPEKSIINFSKINSNDIKNTNI